MRITALILSLLATSAAAEPEFDHIAVYDGWYVYTDGEVCWIAAQSIFPERGDNSPKVQVIFNDEDDTGELSVYDPSRYRDGGHIAIKADGEYFPLDKDDVDPEYAFDNTDGLMDAMSTATEIEVQFTSRSDSLVTYRFSLESFNVAAGHARYHCSDYV